jgi:hypothetical protein
VTLLVLTAGLGTGCKSAENGFDNPGRLQVQFYSPPGAAVTIKDLAPMKRQIAPASPFGDRLESAPEECCVYNLGPGRYEFKYTSADGLPGVSIYGELKVEHANRHEARVMQRRAFIPISLPSEYYRRVEVQGDELFPFRSELYATAIDEHDLVRLRMGDVVEKVFFVADLEKAQERLEKADIELAVCEREIEYADARFRNAYFDFRSDVNDPLANLFGSDRSFIRWEKKRRKLDDKLEDLIAQRKRTKTLLDGDHVLIRKGMLAVATQAIVEPYRDAVKAADDLGEIMLVMRIGGRHRHWGEPQAELVAYEP